MEEISTDVIRFALKGLATRKLRTALTAIAIVLGVALVTGTYILTDSIKGAFNGIFTRGLPRHRRDDHRPVGVRPLEREQHDRAAVRRVAARRGARSCRTSTEAVGGVGGEAHLIGKNGKAIIFGGAPNLGFSVDPASPDFNSLTLIEGNWPKARRARRRQVDRGQEGL